MHSRRAFVTGSVSAALWSQDAGTPGEFVCPMDPDVHLLKPGTCPRCGMKLVAGLPDSIEYRVRLTTVPARPRAGAKVRLRFEIQHPTSGLPVRLETIHERLFHLFLINEDLQHFAHEHPERIAPGLFELDYTMPVGGHWRLLCDFYPSGATPQLIARSLLLPGGVLPPPTLTSDVFETRRCENIEAHLRLTPEAPIAGEKTLLQYRISPREGLEPYLGAMGHMLVASADLIDLIHTHPFLVDGGLAVPPADEKLVQFNVIFPRPGAYRVWAQFQRLGTVNTVPFSVIATAI